MLINLNKNYIYFNLLDIMDDIIFKKSWCYLWMLFMNVIYENPISFVEK